MHSIELALIDAAFLRAQDYDRMIHVRRGGRCRPQSSWVGFPAVVMLMMTTTALAWTVTSTQLSSSADRAFSLLLPPKSFRVRSTIESDLPIVADILATASIQLTTSYDSKRRASFGFMAKLDHLWARQDIEQLLTVRHRAIQEAKKQMQHYSDSQQPEANASTHRLSVLWKSDSFRKLVHRAATETGEPNLWKKHNYQLPPASKSWLQHLQITACDSADGRVVGFLEVAMLFDPSMTTEATASSAAFSPSILNLCVDVPYRRQGLAKRLLQRAERYVGRHWQAGSLGLYVHDNNRAALALYDSMGYVQQRHQKVTAIRDLTDCSAPRVLYLQKQLRQATFSLTAGGKRVSEVDECRIL